MSKLERALAANRRLQERLVGILETIDGALWSNAQMQAKLMHNSWLHPRAGRYRGMRGISFGSIVWADFLKSSGLLHPLQRMPLLPSASEEH